MSAQAGQSFAHSTAPIRPVREVQFGILSPEEIVGILNDASAWSSTPSAVRLVPARGADPHQSMWRGRGACNVGISLERDADASGCLSALPYIFAAIRSPVWLRTHPLLV